MRRKIIRLKRRGAKKNAFFEIVLTFQNRRGNGSGLEKLGFISPKGQRSIAINCERLGFWLNRGALLHPKVKGYLRKLVLC